MAPEQSAALIDWASKQEAIAAVWLFGSRARGDFRPDSDHDIALELMPSRGPADDWAFTAFFFAYDRWKQDIRAILQNEISLVCFREDMECKFDPRVLKIWSRA
ncbi:nucleotidyltransferase family protein [Bradyrhizobium australafricanum]|uniref:nucleotidyltransferase family protein n=1 Tax=Bradyrhizobium australafricanum TaxID=2821406 RepID=UPI001CE26E84|nr:nucleotidyltransferase domain-containing protein [Bradyrhizobium australafricanum]MCA6102787.1 nucleotidyltransferase domain-containing protein [Bradyrhizobium australafricanum]